MRAAAVGPRPGSRGPVPVAPFTQLHGSPLQDSLQLLPRTARHSPGQAGAPLRGHLLPGHLLGHELAGKARGAEHHQVERPLRGRHYEPTAMQGPEREESTAPAPQAATPGSGTATASSAAAAVSAACAPRSRRPARAAAPRPRPRRLFLAAPLCFLLLLLLCGVRRAAAGGPGSRGLCAWGAGGSRRRPILRPLLVLHSSDCPRRCIFSLSRRL